ncbi:MAG: tetratricopeptide repeat protein [Symploca sp. SIO2D2]|nr:tetratricopeptide repeat protein [Symploca sp. SIO2D2]
MDENRLQAYLELIQSLLSCPSGEETQMLQAHRELVDAELVEMMLSVAEQMAAEWEENRANWLRSYAVEIAYGLGMVAATPEEYGQFLIQVLKLIRESGGNPQKIYPLLQANLDKLDDGLTQILQVWATNTLAKVESQQAPLIAAILVSLGNLIAQFPLEKQASNLETAIACYQNALQVYTREAMPVEWATTQSNLAAAYSDRILGDEAQNLEKTIAFYRNALEVRTCEAMPADWASTQNHLAIAYRNRILGDKAQNLEDAIAFHQNALEIHTREAFPFEWAITQNNLGLAYNERILGDKAQNIEDAIAFHQNALEVHTREALPFEWATTQNNLAIAYSDRILGDKAQNLEDAIASYQDALEVYTRGAMPVDWAMTQNNLAAAYSDRILGDKAQNLEDAITSYKNALEVLSREAFPSDWARIQYNLGNTCRERFKLLGKGEDIQQAIASYKLAIEVFQETDNQELLANCSYFLKKALLEGGFYTEAIRRLQSHQEIYQKQKDIANLASTLFELARLYHLTGRLEQARLCFKDSLRLFRRLQEPDKIAAATTALGNLEIQIGKTTQGFSHLKEAQKFYQEQDNSERLAEINYLLKQLQPT